MLIASTRVSLGWQFHGLFHGWLSMPTWLVLSFAVFLCLPPSIALSDSLMSLPSCLAARLPRYSAR